METRPSRITYFDSKPVVLIAAGGYHSLALTSDQSLYAWGDGTYGQTGLGDYIETNSPRPCVSYLPDKTRQVSIASFSKVMNRKEYAIMPYQDKIIKISGGGKHSMILLESGTLYSFGYGAQG